MQDTPLTIDWAPEGLPAGTTVSPHALRTLDGVAVTGFLYARGRARTVVCLMHPREFFACHYLVPALVASGVAVWTQGSRSIGLDLRLEHELAVLDAAAGISCLQGLEFDRIVLLGNSGGAGLYAYYTQQAALAPASRVAKTPAGRPSGLPEATLRSPDGFILLAPHPGQGRLLQGCIDPAVADESDPLSIDPALDAFNPDNGYAQRPGTSRYAPEFVARYRDAQRRRVERLDARARALIGERLDARARLKAKAPQLGDGLRAVHTPILTVWRTDADLRCLDLTLDPSDRAPGSIWNADMLVSNFGAVGFARTCTPESWLSTWSGLSSHAALEKTAPAITCPTLLVEYTGDQTTFPRGIREIYGSIAAADKQHVRVRGDHHGRSLAAGEPPGRALAAAAICDWLRQHDLV